jgi:hypothetical protein
MGNIAPYKTAIPHPAHYHRPSYHHIPAIPPVHISDASHKRHQQRGAQRQFDPVGQMICFIHVVLLFQQKLKVVHAG